jgi:hypothetical protein
MRFRTGTDAGRCGADPNNVLEFLQAVQCTVLKSGHPPQTHNLPSMTADLAPKLANKEATPGRRSVHSARLLE